MSSPPADDPSQDSLLNSSPRGQWFDVEIGGKPVPGFLPTRPREPAAAVLYLHGHALVTLRDNPVYTPLLEQHGLACLCPPGGRGWWTNRLSADFDPVVTPADYLEQSVFPWLEREWHVAPPRVPLVGVSMGGQGALRLAYRQPRRFPIVAAIAPAIDYHQWYGQGYPLDSLYGSAEEARQDTAILYLAGMSYPRRQLIVCDPTDDEWFPSSEKLVGKLSSSGMPHESDLVTSAGGHTWDYFNHVAGRVIGFVATSLEEESRRLDVDG
jgi:pimeloyl-ACP methyl ester carboxylesterase